MQSFEQIRSHVGNLHTLRTNDPYLISFDLTLPDGRHQGIYLAEIDDEDGGKFLRVSTPIGPATGVDAARCTLCMSCVGACPGKALQDNVNAPELRFVEKNCVQCGLCAKTCPEDAITLTPRLNLMAERREPRVVAATQPYGCVRCGKAFGTAKGVEAMLARLAGHAMFQGAALERLKMCADCRVIDMYSAPDESRITDL